MISTNARKHDIPILLGSDGSSHRHAFGTKGAWGISTPHHAIADNLKGWDQTSHCAEVWAGCICILALCKFLPVAAPAVILLCDNLDFVQKIQFLLRTRMQRVPAWPHWALFSAIQQNLKERPDMELCPIWIPGHGKSKVWQRPEQFSEEICRAVNSAADSAAVDANEPSFLACQRMLIDANLRKEWMQKASSFLQFAIADLHVYDKQQAKPFDVILVPDPSLVNLPRAYARDDAVAFILRLCRFH